MGGCRRAEPRPSLEIEPSIHQDSPSTGGATAILIAIAIALSDISIADGIALAGRRRSAQASSHIALARMPQMYPIRIHLRHPHP